MGYVYYHYRYSWSKAGVEFVVWVKRGNGKTMGGGLSPYKASLKGVFEG